ncbi:MAG: histidine phosphatase family protein, partial [Pseudomonadota bacterium]|nr:histidine phosphatase family protein [Pseudomonadota bacterium]
NPALEVTTGLLAADGNPAAMRQLSLKFPTCALAALEFTTDSWPALGPNTGRLAKLSTPKDD